MLHWRFGIVAAVAALILCLPGAQAASAQDQADELEITALDLEAKGDLDGAILKHREAVKLVPKNKAFKENFAKTLNTAAIAKHDAKDDVTAIAYLEEAMAVMPTFKQAQENLATLKTGKINAEGAALFKAGDFAGAVAKFNEVLAIAPDNKPARINRDAAEAQIAMIAGDPATAVAKLTEATTLEPANAFLKGKLADAQAALDAKTAEEAKKKK
jgi:tetratricopeptide (TPR) repeat protein